MSLLTNGIAAGTEFRPVVAPAREDVDAAADFVAFAEVRNAVNREIAGHDDFAMTPAALLPHVTSSEYETSLLWLVLHDGRPVGRLVIDLPQEPGSTVAFFFIDVLREAHGLGIRSAAYDIVERVARTHGRTVLQSWVMHPDTAGPRLTPPTGFGSVPADESAARFLLERGFALEQIERISAFDLTTGWDLVERLRDEARAAATSYRTVSWFAPTPPEFVDGYGWMKSRMITDAPAAGLEFDEEVWDAARVAHHDGLYTGRTMHVVAAQHLETGELCAFNELVLGPDPAAASHQEDTLVLAAHRGHRLGLLVKCENLLAWRGIAPDSPRIITYNAEENRPMLDINEAVGYAPIAYEGAWKKTLVD